MGAVAFGAGDFAGGRACLRLSGLFTVGMAQLVGAMAGFLDCLGQLGYVPSDRTVPKGDCATKGPVTIGDLRREGKRLWIYCLDCSREVETLAADLPFEDAQPVPSAGLRMRCSRCGSRQIETKPQLYDQPIEAFRLKG